jgi:hypothetical protein
VGRVGQYLLKHMGDLRYLNRAQRLPERRRVLIERASSRVRAGMRTAVKPVRPTRKAKPDEEEDVESLPPDRIDRITGRRSLTHDTHHDRVKVMLTESSSTAF